MKNFVSLILLLTIFYSCKKDTLPSPPPPPAPPADTQKILLRDMVIRSLPSPYYHFEYNDSNYITHVDFSSGTRLYDFSYNGRLVKEIKNNHFVNKDRIEYTYSNDQVSYIKIIDENGTVYKRAFLQYSTTGKLTSVEWELRLSSVGYAAYRMLTFTYFPDGNLQEMVNRTYSIPGIQDFSLRSDKFSNYDNKVNADGFIWLHQTDEHLIFLPRIKLQLNNPGKNIRSGDGINYEIQYAYTYDSGGRPLTKTGDVLFTSGPNQGQHFESLYTFSYYE
ncbi:MAG TPA: hypothetical protein VFZ42_02525 [Chitinophagaceae bacterium]